MMALRKVFGTAHFVLAIGLVIGFLASWRLQLEPGTIGLFHDWSISPAGAQNAAYAVQLFNGWYRWILGEPVIYPTEYPLRFAFGAAGAIGVGGAAVSHAFVFIVPAAAFYFAWLLTYQLTNSRVGAIAGGVFYALSPVMLNKMVSGQAAYVVGYCGLPLVLWAYERAIASRSFTCAAGFGAALAIAGIQIQLGLVAAFLSLADAAIPHRATRFAQRLALLLTGLTVAFIIHLPTVVGIFGGAPGYEDRAQFSNSAAYVSMNSVALPEALRLMGYLTRYADVAIQQWSWLWNAAMYTIVAAAFIGIAVSKKRFRVLAVTALFAVLVVISGTQSPFSSGIIWLFAHVRYMQVFRELYHLMAVVALIYACGIAFFMSFVERSRFRWPIYAIASISLLLVSAPMLTGDASGWMRAFPLEQAYGDALKDNLRGSTRVLWLPMDQPLSFDGHGAGVDPMAVTPRGSLWDYALNWPLTAVDADIHNGGDLQTALRALSVGDVVERTGMNSELARFTVDGTDTEPFLARRAGMNLSVTRRYRQSVGYRVPYPIPLTSVPTAIALVPKRLSLCAQSIVSGYAPIAFGEKRPDDVPYAMLYDPGDVPVEAVQMAGLDKRLQTTTIDARLGFAPVDVWWWHRNEYADVPDLTLTFDRHVNTMFADRGYRHAIAVVGWVATSAGGRFRVSAAGHSVDVDTAGSGEWRSRAVPLGPIAQGAPIAITSLDRPAEVAIRSFTVLEAGEYDRAVASWRRTLISASVRVPIVRVRHEALYRSGTSKNLGYLENGVYYRFQSALPEKDMRIEGFDGYPLARISRQSVVFRGLGADARIVSHHRIGHWKIFRVDFNRLNLPKAVSDRPSRLLMWNWAFGDWRTSTASSRYVSAIGTTLFEFAAPQRHPVIYYSKRLAYRASYVAGTAMLVFVLCLTTLRFVKRGSRAEKYAIDLAAKDVTA